MRMPFPFGDRDFVITRWDIKNPGKYVSVISSTVREDRPPAKKYIRGTFEASGIILEQDEKEPEVINMKWVQRIHIRSSAPKWLIGSFWRESRNCLTKIRAKLEGKKLKEPRDVYVKIHKEDMS
jgi:hypothetical protein